MSKKALAVWVVSVTVVVSWAFARVADSDIEPEFIIHHASTSTELKTTVFVGPDGFTELTEQVSEIEHRDDQYVTSPDFPADVAASIAADDQSEVFYLTVGYYCGKPKDEVRVNRGSILITDENDTVCEAPDPVTKFYRILWSDTGDTFDLLYDQTPSTDSGEPTVLAKVVDGEVED